MIHESLGAIPPIPTLIWDYILDCLRWDSPSNLQALSMTCRGFRRLALPVLFESLHVRFRPKAGTGRRLLQDLHGAGDELFHCVRILIVSGYFMYNPEEDTPSLLSPLLVSLVDKLPRLVVLRWRGRFPLPHSLLRHLEARQVVPRMYFEGWLHHLLVAASNHVWHYIRHLNVATSSRKELDELKHVLPALPCLDRLDLKWMTSPLRSQRDTAPLFSLASGNSIPSLRTLCLTNLTVDSNRVTEWDQCHHIRHLGLDGGAESLHLLTLFTGKIPGVASLTLRIHDGTSPGISDDLYSRLDKFLRSVNALAAFTAYDLSKGILPLVVSRHGPHLRRLRFRQTNFNVRDENQIRCHFTFEELQNLASGLPKLQRLGIDLRFKGHLSYDVLSGAACFPSLQHLELNTNFPYGEYGINGHRPMVDSWLNIAVAEEAFRYVAGEERYYERISGHAAVPWPPFSALDIKVGEWEPTLEGYRASILPRDPLCIYACRWVDRRPGKVDIVRLRCLAKEYPIEDDRYEQALARGGLWSVSKLLSGPGTL